MPKMRAKNFLAKKMYTVIFRSRCFVSFKILRKLDKTIKLMIHPLVPLDTSSVM